MLPIPKSELKIRKSKKKPSHLCGGRVFHEKRKEIFPQVSAIFRSPSFFLSFSHLFPPYFKKRRRKRDGKIKEIHYACNAYLIIVFFGFVQHAVIQNTKQGGKEKSKDEIKKYHTNPIREEGER